MNKAVAKYVIISSEMIAGLSYKVRECLPKGWQPMGGVSFDGIRYLQAMVKYEEKKEE